MNTPVKIEKNKFGDVQIIKCENSNITLADTLDFNTKVIYIGFNFIPPDSRKLCKSTEYGTLYGNQRMFKVFPQVKKDTMIGACVSYITRINDIYYCVLVKNRSNGRVTNPVGMCNIREKPKRAGKRELREETGLIGKNLVHGAVWTFETGFAGLKFNGKTYWYYCLGNLPEAWYISGDVTEFETKHNDEIEKIIIASEESVESILSGLHLIIVKEAFRRVKGIEVPPYLTGFQFK